MDTLVDHGTSDTENGPVLLFASNERQAFQRLIFWNGENKDTFWIANREEVPEGWFTVSQAYIHVGWHQNKSRTFTSLERYLQRWTDHGMMDTALSTQGSVIYRWKD